MFGRQVNLFRLFGFPIKVDASWVIIATLVTWSLASGLFPGWFPGLSSQTYWLMGLAGALGLFASILLHELSHSLVARSNGMNIRGITLFVFGGVAEMTDEPPNPRAEFLMAVAGPLASVVISGVSFVVYTVGTATGWTVEVLGVFRYLFWINGLLVLFNSVPAFPLDGGRVLRSLLWAVRGDLRWATRVASTVGSGFGIVLMGLGLFSLLFGNFLGGLWWLLIGFFLRNASSAGYQQVLVRHALEGEPVSRFMRTDPVTVLPALPVSEMVDEYVYRHHFKMFPVVDGGRLVGCVTLQQIKDVPREEWGTTTVGELARTCSGENTISARADAMEALAKMSKTRASRLMVVEDGDLKGIIALKDLLEFFALKVELEG